MMSRIDSVACFLVSGLLLLGASVYHGYGKPPVPGAVRASYYGGALEGHRMANGQRFHKDGSTCASFKFPLNSWVQVTNLENGKSIVIQVTDRGPISKVFSIDLSEGAYKELGLTTRAGWGWVKVEKQ